MTQVSFIYALILLIFLFPAGISKDPSAKKEKVVKNFNPISVNLHLNPSKAIDCSGSIVCPQVDINKGTNIIELPAESFVETPLEMESWMNNPKNWNINY